MTDANEGARETSLPGERSPLLGDGRRQALYNEPSQCAEEAGENLSDAEGHEQDIPIAEEPSTKQLLVILGSIWFGCFLAALGMSISAPILYR